MANVPVAAVGTSTVICEIASPLAVTVVVADWAVRRATSTSQSRAANSLSGGNANADF